jgi:hypothetical protein
MNSKIKSLTQDLERLESESATRARAVREALQKEWEKVFEDSGKLQKAIENAEQACQYQFDRYGEIEAWYYFPDLSDYSDCREYFETWLQESHCLNVEWDSNCLLRSEGPDCLIVQDDTRYGRDNGVWQNGRCVIPESDYKNEDGDVDEVKRNALIESHMERTGYFPGVFRTDQHGNVFPVNTKPKEGTDNAEG